MSFENDVSARDIDSIHKSTPNEISGLTDKPVPAAADIFIVEDSAAGFVKKKISLTNLLATSGLNRVVIFPGDLNSNFDTYRVRSIGGSGLGNFSFIIPATFDSLVSINLVGIPGSAIVAQAIELENNYGELGEQFDDNTEIDLTQTITVGDGEISLIDVSSVFSGVAGGDACGLEINHIGIGASINYIALVMEFMS